MLNRESEGDKLMKRAAHLCRPSLLELRVKADWNGAAPLYEQAVNVYKAGKCWEKARTACEKAAECQEHLGSSWHAGKMFQRGAEMAKEGNDFSALADLYTHAAQAFFEAGRPQAGSEALYKAANKVEEALPERASALYLNAIDGLEQDERFSFGPDLYRSAVGHEIKRKRYDEAVRLLLKFAAICDEKGLHMSVCRSYLGAIVIWCYAENAIEAIAVLRDADDVATFRGSEESRAARALIDAYRSNQADAVRDVVKDAVPFQFLDTAVGRLAIKLPIGDIAEFAAKIDQGEKDDIHADDDEEEDLT